VSTRREHWDEAYWQGEQRVSWHQSKAVTSMELILAADLAMEARIIDIGGGASVLVDQLVDHRFINVTVLDVSPVALDIARRRLGVMSDSVKWIEADLLEWRPAGTYDLWHDRAMLHFLTDERDRARYRRLLDDAVAPGGCVVIGTFAEDGPERCSGLPVRRYSLADQAALLGDAYAIIETRREVHNTPSGGEQPFNWTLARRHVA
jgi:SAM-dependent methyltransferase